MLLQENKSALVTEKDYAALPSFSSISDILDFREQLLQVALLVEGMYSFLHLLHRIGQVRSWFVVLNAHQPMDAARGKCVHSVDH